MASGVIPEPVKEIWADRPRLYRDGPVKLDFRYKPENNEHYFFVLVTGPKGKQHPIGISGHRVSGRSLTWDLVLNPAVTTTCKVLSKTFGLCTLEE